jgi:hypothetical protein
MFCKVEKVTNIGTLLKQHKLADAGYLSEEEDEIAHRENQLSKLYVWLLSRSCSRAIGSEGL